MRAGGSGTHPRPRHRPLDPPNLTLAQSETVQDLHTLHIITLLRQKAPAQLQAPVLIARQLEELLPLRRLGVHFVRQASAISLRVEKKHVGVEVDEGE